MKDFKPLKKKKCKHCGAYFIPARKFQPVCSIKCAIERNREKRQKEIKKQEKEEKKALKKKTSEWKVDTHSKEYRKYLQDEINLLARKIDALFGLNCIDCGKDYGKQVDGAHFHSVGANCSLRYHLHNIHSARSYCNQHSDKHKTGYKEGLERRYGAEYAQKVIVELPIKYKELKLNNREVYDKLKLVRGINRNFSTYQFFSPEQARETLNKIIGIYE